MDFFLTDVHVRGVGQAQNTLPSVNILLLGIFFCGFIPIRLSSQVTMETWLKCV